jgi:hypothetical protein
MLGLFIWFLFRATLSELDKKNTEAVQKKEAPSN